MATISTTIKINDAFSGALDKLSSGLTKAQGGFNRLKSGLGSSPFQGATKQSNGLFKSMTGGVVVGNLISKGMNLAGQGIRSMVAELNEASISWQTFEGNMRQIGKSPAQIASAKADMQKFAQQTIYSAADMSTTYSQLAAVGVKNTGKLVRGFGGLAASAANPQQAMKTLSEQATQMAAKPKVQWMDFKLMLEQAPAGMAAVAKSMGMSTSEMIKQIQAGKMKTTDFLNAVAKVGTNANFSKMATQYKTVGQAMDGLKETLANGLQPQFQKLSKIGIDAISGLTDKLAGLNWNVIGDGLVNAVNYIKPIFSNLANGFNDFLKGFTSTGISSSVGNMFRDIADSVKALTSAMSSNKNGSSLFKQLGELTGGGISGAARAISGIAKAISSLDPGVLKQLALAFIILKGGLKGLVITAVVKGLQELNKLNPGTITAIAKALTIFALALTVIKGAYKGFQMFKGFKDLFGGMKSVKTPKLPTPKVPETPASGGILASAGAFMKLGAALLMVGGAVVLVAFGFKLIAETAQQLASAGAGTIAVFFAILTAIVALGFAVKMLGPGLMEGAIGFIVLGAAILLIGAGVWLAATGLAAFNQTLPIVVQYGSLAALTMLLLSSAMVAIAIGAIIAGVGLAVLAIGLAILGVGFTVAAIGALLFGVALAIVGIGAIVAAVGLMLMAVALILVAAFVLIAAIGMILLGAGVAMVAVMAIMAGVGLMLMAVALMMIMVTAMIAAIGMMLLAVALLLIGPMAMVAAVGLMLLAMATILLGAGLMIVAAGAMAAAAAIMMIGVSVMVMVSLFIAAFSMLVNAATSGMARVRSAISNGISSAVSAVHGFVGAMASAGAALMQGLVNGIKSMIGAAVSAAQSAASKVAGAIKGFLHIGSPSRLMRQYGRWIDQGLINGINRDSNAAVSSALAMAQGIASTVSDLQPNTSLDLTASPGDMLATGYDHALNSITAVSSAITNLNGSKADIGIDSQEAITSNTMSSDGLGANNILNGVGQAGQTDNSTAITIAPGAISINSSGNADYDADILLRKIEDRLMAQRAKALF